MSFFRILFTIALILASAPFGLTQEKTPLTLIVMDPLAAPLSCPCVKGYAQRDYEKLANHLEKQLGREVKLHFNE